MTTTSQTSVPAKSVSMKRVAIECAQLIWEVAYAGRWIILNMVSAYIWYNIQTKDAEGGMIGANYSLFWFSLVSHALMLLLLITSFISGSDQKTLKDHLEERGYRRKILSAHKALSVFLVSLYILGSAVVWQPMAMHRIYSTARDISTPVWVNPFSSHKAQAMSMIPCADINHNFATKEYHFTSEGVNVKLELGLVIEIDNGRLEKVPFFSQPNGVLDSQKDIVARHLSQGVFEFCKTLDVKSLVDGSKLTLIELTRLEKSLNLPAIGYVLKGFEDGKVSYVPGHATK
jgi:hypothetical protein